MDGVSLVLMVAVLFLEALEKRMGVPKKYRRAKVDERLLC